MEMNVMNYRQIRALVFWPSPSSFFPYSEHKNIGIQWLEGGLNPSEKYESQLGWLFPLYGKFKNDPNHQPDYLIYSYLFSISLSNILASSCKSECVLQFHLPCSQVACNLADPKPSVACSTKVRGGVGQRPSSRSDFSFFLFFFGVSASALASKHQVEKVAWQDRTDLRVLGHMTSYNVETVIGMIVLQATHNRKVSHHHLDRNWPTSHGDFRVIAPPQSGRPRSRGASSASRNFPGLETLQGLLAVLAAYWIWNLICNKSVWTDIYIYIYMIIPNSIRTLRENYIDLWIWCRLRWTHKCMLSPTCTTFISCFLTSSIAVTVACRWMFRKSSVPE